MLLLHFTFASGIGVMRVVQSFSFSCSAEFSFLSFRFFRSVKRERVSVKTVTYVTVRLIGRIERIESCD